MTVFTAKYTDREIEVERTENDTLIEISKTYDRDDRIFAYLDDETAHALAAWIIENVPKPKPKPVSPTLEDWAKIPIGAELGFGRETFSGEYASFPYRKVSDWEYANRIGSHKEDIREGTEIDLSRGLRWRVVPLPTGFGAVVKSGGVLYTLADKGSEPKWFKALPAGGTWVNGSRIQEQGFEVIFAGVED